VLLAVALLSMLVFGSAFGGVEAWFHSHGPSGGHVHVLPEEREHGHEHDVADLAGWHRALHGSGDEGPEHEEDGPVPEGFLLELPPITVAAPRDLSVGSALFAPMAAAIPCERPSVHSCAGSTWPGPARSGWPPQGSRRSGIAGLLRSSHAILI
jgi:hypothetical protein